MKLYTNDCQFASSPSGRLFAEVWVKCIGEFLRETAYMAQCASLNYSLALGPENVSFQWSGFSDSLVPYVNQTIDMILKFKGATNMEEIFDEAKESLVQSYQNYYLQ